MSGLTNFTALLLLLSGVQLAAPKQPVSPAPPNRYFIDNVPFTSQLPNFCGPASLSSLLAFWHKPVDQQAIADRTYDSKVPGTNGADLLLYCRDSGLSAYSFNGTLAQLKRLISDGYPVITLQDRARTWTAGHFRVAVGYNDEKQTITLRDSVQSSYVNLSYTEFDYLWAKRGRWALVVTTADRDRFQDTLGRSNAVLHMDLAQAYLRRRDFQRAEAESRLALDVEPNNSYAMDLLSRSTEHRPRS